MTWMSKRTLILIFDLWFAIDNKLVLRFQAWSHKTSFLWASVENPRFTSSPQLSLGQFNPFVFEHT